MAETNPGPARHPRVRGRPKTRLGEVTSHKMQKTVVVTVQRAHIAAHVRKIMNRREKYKANVEDHQLHRRGGFPSRSTRATGRIAGDSRLEGQALECGWKSSRGDQG